MKTIKLSALLLIVIFTSGCNFKLNRISLERIKIEVYGQEYCKDKGGVHRYADSNPEGFYTMNCLDGSPFKVSHKEIIEFSHPRVAEIMKDKLGGSKQ